MAPPAAVKRLARLHAHLQPHSIPLPQTVSLCDSSVAGTRLRKVLIANRSLAAIRIAQAAADLGIHSVAIFDIDEDFGALHCRLCDEAAPLPQSKTGSPYLNGQAILAIARQCGADCVHPGYGFLAESAEFAHQCAVVGLTFIGPPAGALRVFGDKTCARRLAATLQPPVPTLAGSDEAFECADEAFVFVQRGGLVGKPLMLKAAHGGGGRGMRRLPAGVGKEEFVACFRGAQSEAIGAFGLGAVFVEELLEHCRHVEVQVVADAGGQVAHLFERDCSVQVGSGSKVLEICPAVGLDDDVRQQLLIDAVRLVAATPGGVSGVLTVEFLVDASGGPGSRGRHVFIEVNPRLQVEHGVTEEACGVDLVRAQFRLAAGESLQSSFGVRGGSNLLTDHSRLFPEPVGWAVEARVCLSSAPQAPISRYREPGGRGIRVESSVHAGLRPSGRYDPLIALVIGKDESVIGALGRVERAINSFSVGGVTTNLRLLREILRSSDVRMGAALTTTTSWREEPGLLSAVVLESSSEATDSVSPELEYCRTSSSQGHGREKVSSPLDGLLRWEVAEEQHVIKGQTLGVVLAMKMETPVKAQMAGRLRLKAMDGAEVRRGQQVAVIEEMDQMHVQTDVTEVLKEPLEPSSHNESAAKWQAVVSERTRRAAEASQREAAALEERRKNGRLTIRARVVAVLDADTFCETGPVAGTTDKAGLFIPANFVLGTGRIGGRPVVIGGEDFTIQGGSPNVGGLAKSVFCEKFALQLRIPLVRLHEGGGGAVVGGKKKQLQAAPTLGEPSRFSTIADCLGMVPVATAALGAVAGLPASRLVAAHFVVAVRGAQVLVAGPRVAENATGRRMSKEELGGEAVHGSSGVVDNYVASEHEAFEQIRLFLSYLPSNVHGLPPSVKCVDSPSRREEELLAIIPSDRGPYDMRRLIRLVVDRELSGGEGNSFFEIGTSHFGKQVITGFARFGGHPVGVFANNPMELGGAMTWQASIKTRRFIELCCTFHLPIVTFVDQPGFMVGLEAEKAGTIRFGTAAVLAAQTALVPWCSVQVRKAYGVAAAAHFGPDAHVILWPSAETGTLPVEAGVKIMYRRQLDAALPGERRRLERQLVEELHQGLSPWPTVQSFGASDLVDPRETRQRLCEWTEMAQLRLPAVVGPKTFPYRC